MSELELNRGPDGSAKSITWPFEYQYTNDTYPVVVFIHGGDFQSGGGSDYPQQAILDNFVSRKIIFVTFNYRLGPLGFLSTGDKILPGNVGLWDQIWALKWVKANAEVFGGDPGNILVMGSGSGAACASILALSPRTEAFDVLTTRSRQISTRLMPPEISGLFHKILLMSGSALQPGVVRDTAINATWALNEKMQCRYIHTALGNDVIFDSETKLFKVIQFIRTVGLFPEEDERGNPRLQAYETRANSIRKFMAFAICCLSLDKTIEDERLHWDDYQEFVPVVDGPGGVIPDTPEDLAKHRKKIPMMIGTTKDESSLRILILNEKNVNFSALNTPLAEKLADNLTMGYKQFQNHRLIAEGCKAQYVWTKMYSHFWYDAPASRLATYYAKQKAPVFLYSFDHISENFYDYDRAFHGADKLHLFNITPRFLSRRKDRNWQLDQRVVEIFADLIVNFARHGYPTPENSGFSFNWTSTNAMELNYLSITDSPTMEFATAMLAFCSLFFFAILVGLACYCTRKESDDDDL
ncbi:Carboxylesterase [Ancylostoma ceylanicum]|uniref:Carboxylesterase n=1 Tax=Ancylostoma ceylanicum TaxID=53326 RepID=A0A0D6LB45_9BILA|nr:Carboxylesterase [Ancylostoma ceylanicum]